MRSFIAASLLLGASFSPAAASTVTLDYVGQDPGARAVYFNFDGADKSASAGQFKFDIVGTAEQLLAWCVDITTYLKTDATVHTETPDMFGAPILTNLDKLFTQHYADVVDATSSAAFQTAIWEIVYDTGDLDLADGRFALRDATADAVETMAASFLSLGEEVGGYVLSFFDSGTDDTGRAYSQDLVSAAPSAVPLPASALLLLAGMGALGAARRRR